MMTLKKPKIAVFSDLHLGIHGNSTAWHDIAIKWAKWIRDDLKSRNIKDIIFCGDWHHSRSEIAVNTLQVSADILDILKDFDIKIILGNHDIFYKNRNDVNSISIFKRIQNVTIIDRLMPLEAFDRKIIMCPWGTKAEEIPKADVVFGHFEIESFKMNSYKVCEEGLKIKDLLSVSPLIISGHFHLRHEKKFGSGTILYVGNPFQMDFGDVENVKGYYILDLDSLEYTFYENNVSPKYVKISLSDLVKKGNLTPDITSLFANNMVKLKLDKNISQEDLTFLVHKLNQLHPEQLLVDYDLEFNKINENTNNKDLSGIDIHRAIEEFIDMLDVQDKKSILDYTLDLYNKSL